MLRKFLKTALVASSLATGATSAQAASVQSAQLTLGSSGKITAIAEDGQTYSKLESTGLIFHGSVHVTMGSGQVDGLAIYNGACGGLCPDGLGYKLLFQDKSIRTKNLDKNVAFDVSADDYPQGLTQNLEASKIFQACHDRMSGSVVGSDATFTHLMKVTLSLELHDGPTGWQEQGSPFTVEHDWWDDFTVPVTVTCKATEPQVPGGMVQDMGEFKTTGIDLFLTTYADATTQPNPATTCKKVRVLVRVNTSKAGPAKFKLWTKVGNGQMTSKVVDVWSSFDGNSGYKAEHTEWVSVSEPTQVQAMAEDMVNSIGQSTQWKDIMLQCTSPGGGGKGGGLTVGIDEPMLPDLKVTGDFSYVDVGSPQCSRTGKALISFTSNRSDNIHYSLDCTNGQHLSGYVKPVPVTGKGYVAAAMQSFQIDTTTVYSCALKTVQPGPVKLHQWKGHTFKCVDRAVDSGSDDVQVAPKPSDDAPQTPADVKVAPQPTDVDAVKKREEALKKAREAALKQAEAEKKAAEEARRKQAEAEKKAAEEARRKQAEAAKKAAEEARRKQAEAAKKAAEEARRKKAEAEKKAAEEAKRKQAEAAKRAAEEARRKKAEAAKKAAEEAKRKQAAQKVRKLNAVSVNAVSASSRRR